MYNTKTENSLLLINNSEEIQESNDHNAFTKVEHYLQNYVLKLNQQLRKQKANNYTKNTNKTNHELLYWVKGIGIATGVIANVVLIPVGFKAGTLAARQLAAKINLNPAIARQLGIYLIGPYVAITGTLPSAVMGGGICRDTAVRLITIKPKAKRDIEYQSRLGQLLTWTGSLLSYLVSLPSGITEAYLTMHY